jgi:CDP-6-deoxy-D-xylo-4-hexulose-3-dehydrase
MKKINPGLKKLIKENFGKNFTEGKFIPGQTPIPASGKVFNEREIELMVEAVLDGWWTEGRFNQEFEKKLASWLGRRFCAVTNSGSSANLLALTALTSFKLGKGRLKKGDEVIAVAAAFPTTVNPIIQNNLTPVFVDIDLGTYNVNIEQLKKAISKKTKAIFLAHTLGNPFNLNEILRICQKHNLWLIEDNCDALGSLYKRRKTGTFGHLSTQSFYPAHHITTGEGGAVLTDNPLLDKIVRSLRDWGRDCWCRTGHDNTCKRRFSWQLGDLPAGYDHKYIYSEIGYNLKNTDIEAALGLAQLKKIDGFIKRRRENFNFLYKNLEQFRDYFILPQTEKFSQPSWFGFLITLKDNCPFSREDLLKYLNKYKIGTRLLFGGNITKQPYFKNYRIKFRKVGPLENTDKIMKDTFWIGIYPGLNREKLSFVINVFTNFFKKYGK